MSALARPRDVSPHSKKRKEKKKESVLPPKCHFMLNLPRYLNVIYLSSHASLRAAMAPGRGALWTRVLNPFPRRHYPHVLHMEARDRKQGGGGGVDTI